MTIGDNRELGAPAEALRIDTARLDDYLRAHIDGYAGGGDVRQFLGGQSNPTYLIEDASGTYVLRKKPPGKLLPSAHAVDREYRVISALAGSGVPVPRARVLFDERQRGCSHRILVGGEGVDESGLQRRGGAEFLAL